MSEENDSGLPARLMKPVLDIAQEAGERIIKIYRTEFEVDLKDDQSPLTQADMAAHKHIVNALEKLEPALPILSEEGAGIPFEKRRRWSQYWLVDPLDGTREFVKRNGEFTVNIALIQDHRPVLGVVHAPALGLSYVAAEGGGAYRQDGVRRVRLRTRPLPPTPIYVVSRSHQDPALAALLAKAPEHQAVSRGSSLKFCLIAEAAADFYPRTGPTSEWDTAAGQCVLEQAGGAVWQLPERTPLAYNQKSVLLNPSFAAVGDTDHRWDELLSAAAGPAA